MITIRYIDGRYCPFVICDHCGKPIVEHGNVLFHLRGEHCTPVYVHKGDCDHAKQQAAGEYLGWEELSQYLTHLMFNSGLPDLLDADHCELSKAFDL